MRPVSVRAIVALHYLLVVSCLSARAAGEGIPPVPPVGGAVVDALAPADDAAARAAWRPMNDESLVSAARAGDRKVVRFRCRFAGSKVDRASWDFPVALNMNAGRGLEVQFYSQDSSAVSGFSVYFRSGGGWYHAHVYPEQQGRWCTLRAPKQGTQVEGTPAGWGKVDLVRISAWRGESRDAEFCLADLRLTGADAAIAILRADAAGAEARYAAQVADAMDRRLAHLGLDAVALSDLGLDASGLGRRKLVILPHNPHLPQEAALALRKYVAGGGKILAFFTLYGELARECGVGPGQFVRQKAEGDFASIRPLDPAPPLWPAQVGQKSWNINAATPVEGRSKVVAVWHDAAGRPTGHPAVIASDRCVYMSHVLLEDDYEPKQRMLLAMISLLCPELVQQAVAGRIAQAGRVAGCADPDQLRDAILKRSASGSPAHEAIDQARRQHAIARESLAAGKVVAALDAADQTRRLALRAWCLAQTPLPGEHRAFWCHSAFGVQGMDWEQTARELARQGFTAVIPNMLWGGLAYYDSRVLPVADEVKTRGDQIALAAAACRKAGIACHVWKVNYNCAWNAPKDFVDRMEAQGRMQRNARGEPLKGWLCPSCPDNQKLEIDAMVEVARKYDVDGVHFDYIRYPGPDGCFCDGCRQRFEAALGRKVDKWPADLRQEPLRQRWLDWRREQITAVVAGTAQVLRKERPRMKISAAVFPNYPVDRDGVGQDWKLWCERGYLDFVCPMDYTDRDAQFENLVAQQKVWAGKVPCYPGIGLSCWGDKDVCSLMSKIDITRRLNTGGFTIFELNRNTIEDTLPLLGLGITRAGR